MVELTDEQKELTEKLKILDKDVKILWKDTGIVSLIDGLITIPITKNIDESISHFLMEYSALFGNKKDLSDLKFISKSPGFDTVQNSEFKIIMVKNNYYPSIELDTQAIINGGISKEKAIEIAHLNLNAETRLKRDSTANIVILPKEDEIYLVWEVNVSLKNPSEGHYVYVEVRYADIVKKIDIFKRKTTGKGRVFIPNPVIALKNPNLTADDTPNRAYEPSLLFYYTRGDSRFCEVMAYYHIDSCQRFIQELGFTNICSGQIKVNACAEGSGSYFDSDSKSITYGSVGIPDAEDADIIIHEYAHAILDDQVPFLGLTEEGCAME